MKYFEIFMNNKKKWILSVMKQFSSGVEIDIWAYSKGIPAKNEPVPFAINVCGQKVDFNLTAFGTIVISSKMAQILNHLCQQDIQLIPAIIENDTGKWYVLNVVSVIDCIDYDLSTVQYYQEDETDRSGKPRGISKMIIKRNNVVGHHIFKPLNWLVSTIISSDLKTVLKKECITGIDYIPVC